jgi:broad specificity phosphatase PhoE
VHTLILARHAHAASNADDVVNGVAPGKGLTPLGVEQALALRAALAAVTIDLGACTELLRTRETLAAALEHRSVPVVVVPELNEMSFGSLEGGPLTAYRAWAWENDPVVPCPGGGESRAAAAGRFADGLEALLEQPGQTVLAITHALPVRYIIDAAAGRFPAARVGPVAHAVATTLQRDAVETAAGTLRSWSQAPQFLDTPFGG